MQLTGRQTQFYIDIVYGVVFAAGFSVLLFGGMDPRIAAFMGGLILGYFLRVWENMSVYERILHDEVVAEAGKAVVDEAEATVPDEVTAEIGEQLPDEVTSEVERQMTDEIADQIRERVSAEVAKQIDQEIEDRLAEIAAERDEG